MKHDTISGMGVVLLVRKTPLAERLDGNERQRLEGGGVLDRARLDHSAQQQQATLVAVRAALAGMPVRERRVDEIGPADAMEVDLVVTVGGDGTVFAANTLPMDAPFFTVNSDPERSVGHFTRFTVANAAEGLAAWRAGTLREEPQYRLAVQVGDRSWRILNDCLFAHSNPAVLCRYVLEADRVREFQRSSGVWIATAAGSTAAIRSAGSEPVSEHLAALLFRVREPYHDKAPARLLAGTQIPPRGIGLTPAIPGMALYLDGPNQTVPVPAGMPVTIVPEARPLRLLSLR